MLSKKDIGSDTEYSAELSEASLKNLLDTAKIDLVQYLKYADPKVVPFAKKMLEEMQSMEMEGDNIAEVIMQIQELDPQQREQFLAQDIQTIMASVAQILGQEPEQ